MNTRNQVTPAHDSPEPQLASFSAEEFRCVDFVRCRHPEAVLPPWVTSKPTLIERDDHGGTVPSQSPRPDHLRMPAFLVLRLAFLATMPRMPTYAQRLLALLGRYRPGSHAVFRLADVSGSHPNTLRPPYSWD